MCKFNLENMKIIKIALIIGGLLFMGLIVVFVLMPVTGSKKSAQESANNAKIISSMSTIWVGAELYFEENGSYKGFDCYSSYSVISECNSIKNITGVKPIVFASEDKHCSYVLLLDKKTYYCIDSTGTKIETTINPNKIGYCDSITFVCPTGK